MAGELSIAPSEAHHARDVLRLNPGTAVEVFDDAGNIGIGTLDEVSEIRVTVRIDSIQAAPTNSMRLIVASAIPKASRGDWMVEKLSELGVDAFIPLATQRSVVLPEGKNKLDRWQRLANEAAKQSHRIGVMRIASLTLLPDAIESAMARGAGWYFSTHPDAPTIGEMIPRLSAEAITLFIGPEGGWTPEEQERFATAKVVGVSLTRTILRVETAAIAASAIVASLFNPRSLP